MNPERKLGLSQIETEKEQQMKSKMTGNISATIPLENLEKLSGWDKLDKHVQDLVRDETIKAADALVALGNAKMAVGEHLSNVQNVLEPLRLFTKYLNSLLHISRPTAYRYIAFYREAKAVLPAPVFQQAMLRADDRLNIRLIKESKPPKTTNIVAINEYLDSVQRGQETKVTAMTTEECERAIYRDTFRLLNRVQPRNRVTILSRVVGAILDEMGITSELTIKPQPLPTKKAPKKTTPPKKAVASVKAS